MSDFSGGDDPILRELLPGYLARRREELETMAEALEKEDFAALQTIGHNLFGSGGAYGLAQVSELGRELESAAKTADRGAIENTVQKMRVFLDELSV